MLRSSGGPYVPLSEAIKRLGEDGERELVEAHQSGKIRLSGRHRQPREGTCKEHDYIPPLAFAEYEYEPTSTNGEHKAAGAVRINREANSIEADASTTDFATFERLAHCGWEDVKVAALEIEALARSLNGEFTAPLSEYSTVRLDSVDKAINVVVDKIITKKRGRPKGSGSYEKKDAVIVQQMHDLIEKGECNSPSRAAQKLIDLIEGGGEDDAKIKRVVAQYNKLFQK